MSPILAALKYETHVVFPSSISAFPIAFGIFFLKNHMSNVIVLFLNICFLPPPHPDTETPVWEKGITTFAS